MEIRIKNMVCDRCITVVQNIFSKNNIKVKNIDLGVAFLIDELSDDIIELLKNDLKAEGFEVLNSKSEILIGQVKAEAIKYINDLTFNKPTFSIFLSKNLGQDYKVISQLFAENEGHSIVKYLTSLKIEKVKELLEYDEYSIAQIADMLGYSSPAYLTKQFKEVTGLNPSAYKNQLTPRVSLDKL